MSDLIEIYIDQLLQNPEALPPAGMDAATAAFVRTLVREQVKPTPNQRARMWQRSLDAAKTANRAHSQTTTFTPSSNGHKVHHPTHDGEDHMTQITIPFNRPYSTRRSKQWMSVLPLAAAITVVVFAAVLFASVDLPTGTFGSPNGDPDSGSMLQQIETGTPTPAAAASPTTEATATPLPTLVPGSSSDSVLEYVIQPGDTLFSILQGSPFNYSDLSILPEILALNPSIEQGQLPAPGMSIFIPVRNNVIVPINSDEISSQPALPVTVGSTGSVIIAGGTGGRSRSDDSLSLTLMPIGAIPDNASLSYSAQQDETLLSILLQFGYNDLTIAQFVLALNPTLSLTEPLNAGTIVVLPVPNVFSAVTAVPVDTATPLIFVTAEPLPWTPTSAEAAVRGSTEIGTYTIAEGDTLLDILVSNDMTLETFAQLNPQLYFSRCDFSRLTGGMTCTVTLETGETVRVTLLNGQSEIAATALPPTVVQPAATSTPLPATVLPIVTATPTAVP